MNNIFYTLSSFMAFGRDGILSGFRVSQFIYGRGFSVASQMRKSFSQDLANFVEAFNSSLSFDCTFFLPSKLSTNLHSLLLKRKFSNLFKKHFSPLN